MSTSRIGGDYSAEALDAFRAAYAAQMQTPEELDVAPNGLPGNEISNTSPWHADLPLWRYPSGKGPESDLRQPFNPQDFLPEGSEDGELTEDELDAYLDSLSEEELSALAQELASDDEDDMIDQSDDDESITDDEIDALISEILNSDDN